MSIPFLRQKDIRLIEQLTQDVKLLFAVSTLQQGWADFLNGVVRYFDTDDRWQIIANVAGVAGGVEVKLDLHSIRDTGSVCTCGYEGYCEHIAAVLFFFYKKYGLSAKLLLEGASFAETRQSQTFIAGVPSRAKSEPRQPPAPPAAALQAQAPVSKSARKPEPSITETDLAAVWRQFFEQVLDEISITSPNSIGAYRQAVSNRLAPYANNWSEPSRHLFHVHIQLFMLPKLEASFQEVNRRYYMYGFENAYIQHSSEITAVIAKLIRQPDSRLSADKHQSLRDGIAQYLAECALNDSRGVVDWIHLYRDLWTELLYSDGKMVRQEKERLQHILDTSPPSHRRDLHALALAHFDVLDGQDERAMELLDRELQGNEPILLFEYLPMHRQAQRWEKVQSWLRWLLPRMKEGDPDLLEAYCGYWLELGKQRSMDEEPRQALLYLLPESMDILADYLLKRNHYREWVDLMLLCEVTADYADPAMLRKLETQDPTAALAYLHQSIEQLILRKNRDAYRDAVELLERLSRIYEKRRERERWQQYIEHLRKQYARQRAFQEELKKGKIRS